MTTSVTIIGAGHLGSAIIGGLISSAVVPASSVVVCDRDEARAHEVAGRHGATATADPAEATESPGLVVVAVNPGEVGEALAAAAPSLTGEHTVVSCAAGVPTGTVASHLPQTVPVVRAMPNVAARVGEAVIALAAGPRAGDDDLDDAEALFAPVGSVVRIAERHFDAVTAVSGSGPAYAFLLTEALVEAGVQQGLPREVATTLAAQTLAGAATMLADEHLSPGAQRERVTSPGGTTAAGVRALERGGVRSAVADAVEAARGRAGELSG